MKIHDNYEMETFDIVLTEHKYPIAYNNKMQELVESGCYATIEEAKNDNPTWTIEMEMYYEKFHGLFAVESESLESGCDVCSPYTTEVMEHEK